MNRNELSTPSQHVNTNTREVAMEPKETTPPNQSVSKDSSPMEALTKELENVRPKLLSMQDTYHTLAHIMEQVNSNETVFLYYKDVYDFIKTCKVSIEKNPSSPYASRKRKTAPYLICKSTEPHFWPPEVKELLINHGFKFKKKLNLWEKRGYGKEQSLSAVIYSERDRDTVNEAFNKLAQGCITACKAVLNEAELALS